jgi:N-methylhydantoinase A
MSFVIGVDIGGTFTDCVVLDASGRRTVSKARSTPPTFEDGFLDALGSAASLLGTPLTELLPLSRVFHGCTVGTNALVEGRTARVGLLTTVGHSETLFMMQAGQRLKGLPPEYVAHVAGHRKPEPLVERHLVGEVNARVAFDGKVLVDIDETQIREEVQRLLEAGVEAIAIALLWSVVDDSHERAVGEIIRSVAPDIFISLSSDVAPRVGEYERTTATVINALIGPPVSSYLGALEAKLEKMGYSGTLGIMSCWGGLVDAQTARRLPLLTINSGPVAGVIATNLLALQEPRLDEKRPHVITTDMGGTTFDVSLNVGTEPVVRSSSKLGQYEYFQPSIDVRAVGAGGGSIIRYDEPLSTLRVGPRSAGARPGPAAFRLGGTEATVTDADLILGYLNPDYFLGGTFALGVDEARGALARAGAPLGFDHEATAAAGARIVDSQMADAIRLASIDQGHDPRVFTLYAYGGNGPVHATALAEQLGITRVVVPLGDLASGWSAFGVAAAEAQIYEQVAVIMASPFDPDALNTIWGQLEERAAARITAQGIPSPDIRLERSAELKYTAQISSITVAAPTQEYDDSTVKALVEEFEAQYERLYGVGSGYAAAGFALTALGVRARATLTELNFGGGGGRRSREPEIKGARRVIWYERGLQREETPVIDGRSFQPGMTVIGPAIVEFPQTTLVVRHGQRATGDPTGSVTVHTRHSEGRD